MKTVFILFVVLLLSSCANNPTRYLRTENEVLEKDKKALQDWMLTGMKNANPMSDEEPEDMIKQLEKTGLKLFGQEVQYYEYWNNGRMSKRIKVSDWTPEIENKIMNGGKE